MYRLCVPRGSSAFYKRRNLPTEGRPLLAKRCQFYQPQAVKDRVPFRALLLNEGRIRLLAQGAVGVCRGWACRGDVRFCRHVHVLRLSKLQ